MADHAGRAVFQAGIDDPRGNAQRGKSVTVYLRGTGTLATIYADRDKTALANPTTTDSAGNLMVFADPGDYDAVINGATLPFTVLPDWEDTVTDDEGAAGLPAHLADPTDAHDASAVSFVPTGTVAATNVQAAVAEVASDAAALVTAEAGTRGTNDSALSARIGVIEALGPLATDAEVAAAIAALSDIYAETPTPGATAVVTSGNQTVDGVKTFSSAPVVPDGAFTTDKIAGLDDALASAGDPDAITDATWTPASIRGVVLGVDSLEPEGAIRPTVYGWDTFTRANSTSAPGSTEVGAKAWSTDAGTVGVIAGAAYASALSSGAASASFETGAGAGDLLVEADVVYQGQTVSLQIAKIDAANFLQVAFANGLAALSKTVAGAATNLAITGGTTLVAGNTYHVAIRRTGGTGFEWVINGVPQAGYTLSGGDATSFNVPTASRVGWATGDVDNRVDNFRCRSGGVVDGLGVYTGINLAPGQAAAIAVAGDPAFRPAFHSGAGSPYFDNPISGAALPFYAPVSWSDGVTVFVVGRAGSTALERILSLNATVDMSAATYSDEFWPTGNAPWPTGIAMPENAYGVYGFTASRAGFPVIGTGVKAFGGSKSIFRTRDANNDFWPLAAITGGTLLARGAGQGSERFTGRLKGLWIIPRYLDDTTIRLMRRYLARANGLTVPADPTQRVIFDGDSLTGGNTGTAPAKTYTDRVLAALTGATDAYNLGISGQTVVQLAADASAQVDPLVDESLAQNVVVVWVGTNDLTNGDAAATVYANLVAYCQARQAAGFEVVVLTALPRGASAPFETARQTFNASIRTNWATFADALADVGADSTIGEPGDQNNTTYYSGDAIHMTAAGYAVVAGLVTTALAGLGVT